MENTVSRVIGMFLVIGIMLTVLYWLGKIVGTLLLIMVVGVFSKVGRR